MQDASPKGLWEAIENHHGSGQNLHASGNRIKPELAEGSGGSPRSPNEVTLENKFFS